MSLGHIEFIMMAIFTCYKLFGSKKHEDHYMQDTSFFW